MNFAFVASLFKNKWVGHLSRFGLGVLAIYLLIHTGALKPRLLATAVTTHPWWYASAFILYAVILEGIAYVRWYWLLREAKVNVTPWFVLRLHLIGLFFSGLLPGGTGGDFVKGFYLLRGRDKVEGSAALGTMVLDRFAGTLGLLWLGGITNLLNHDLWERSRVLSTQTITFIGMTLASAILVSIYLSSWKPEWLPTYRHEHGDGNQKIGFWKGLLASMVAFREKPLVFWGVLAMAMSVHLSLVGVYALCAHALEIDIPFRYHAYIVPTLTMLNGIPLSPAGLGFGEAGGGFLYHVLRVRKGGGTDIAALVHSIVFLTSLVCAPAYLFRQPEKKPGS